MFPQMVRGRDIAKLLLLLQTPTSEKADASSTGAENTSLVMLLTAGKAKVHMLYYTDPTHIKLTHILLQWVLKETLYYAWPDNNSIQIAYVIEPIPSYSKSSPVLQEALDLAVSQGLWHHALLLDTFRRKVAPTWVMKR